MWSFRLPFGTLKKGSGSFEALTSEKIKSAAEGTGLKSSHPKAG